MSLNSNISENLFAITFQELKLRCSELSVKIQTDEIEFRAKVQLFSFTLLSSWRCFWKERSWLWKFLGLGDHCHSDDDHGHYHADHEDNDHNYEDDYNDREDDHNHEDDHDEDHDHCDHNCAQLSSREREIEWEIREMQRQKVIFADHMLIYDHIAYIINCSYITDQIFCLIKFVVWSFRLVILSNVCNRQSGRSWRGAWLRRGGRCRSMASKCINKSMASECFFSEIFYGTKM